MPNVMVALRNIGGTLCSTSQSLADAHYLTAVQKPVEISWGAPNSPTVNRSQPLVVQCSPYCGEIWRTYCCLTSFFCSICALVAKIWPDKVVRWCRDGDFLRPVFSASRVQHISDMHFKFALRPHHVWKYGRHPICDR